MSAQSGLPVAADPLGTALPDCGLDCAESLTTVNRGPLDVHPATAASAAATPAASTTRMLRRRGPPVLVSRPGRRTASVLVGVVRFGDINVDWLAKVLSEAGVKDTEARALAIFAAVGGAQLAARSRGDIKVYDAIVESYRKAGLIPA